MLVCVVFVCAVRPAHACTAAAAYVVGGVGSRGVFVENLENNFARGKRILSIFSLRRGIFQGVFAVVRKVVGKNGSSNEPSRCSDDD